MTNRDAMFGCQALYFKLIILVYLFLPDKSANANSVDEGIVKIEVLNGDSQELLLGSNVTIICKSELEKSFIWWTFMDRNLTEKNGYIFEKESENVNKISGKKSEVSILHIINVNFHHVGDYFCHTADGTELDFKKLTVNVSLPANVLKISTPVRAKLHKPAHLYCVAQGYPLSALKWYKSGTELAQDFSVNTINATTKNLTFHVKELTKKDNGTYTCQVETLHNSVANSSVDILVIDKPHVKIDFVKAIGKSKIYLNWTANDGNEPSSLFFRIQYMTSGDSNWFYYQHQIGGYNRSYVLQDIFKPDTKYFLRIVAINSEGESQYSATTSPVATLSVDPEFIPDVKVTGVTMNSITISWENPPETLKDVVHFYKLIARVANKSDVWESDHYPNVDKNIHMFSNLTSATTYDFQVAACSEYSKLCGNFSTIVNGTTMDGLSGPPGNVTVECRWDNVSQTGSVFVSWAPPHNPQGTVMWYDVHLQGKAGFVDELGVYKDTTWGPKVKSVNTLSTRFYNASANTNYTIFVSAVTRMKRSGENVEMRCEMPAAVPDKQKLSRIKWTKVEEQGRWMLQLSVPRISERNGPICCYRVFLVRMEGSMKLTELPPPENLNVSSYQEAHGSSKGGTYLAEMFSSEYFHPEIYLGDGQVLNVSTQCNDCVERKEIVNASLNRVRGGDCDVDPMHPCDGTLDINSNYTAFVEITVCSQKRTQVAYSGYLAMLNPGPHVLTAPPASPIGLVIQVLCALVVIALILLTALCLLLRYTKQAHAQAVEMITFRTSLRHLCRNLRGRQRLVSLNPPDMCPIARSDLVAAYIERHRDSDYGFQQEFEMLPDRFSDRTTRASDAKENMYKNRYPDIKAYDQTRVKISQIDSIAGSDYINANYVLGYKERKKFICAQGPMDTTVNDFWRMIWEQHLELVLMLTNLEEYSKTKCAKYWPEKNEGEKVFGEIIVSYFQEIRYSDYIVRELKITRTGGRDKEERHITQYHYLVWKDFMAPEHPHGILKFIKRMNEAYSMERGCILVHCSAGVGRTGTLVALDCLLQQLKDEDHVAIFNTICDLRHQRNFLVQSLKQYIFIYRALMEVAQYGDAEIVATQLKASVDKLKRYDKDTLKCKMEDDFENIKNAFEDRKSCSVASGDENREKNRSELVVPYDRNRVILTPVAGKEHSTYINASFIEGYDNLESFIITQDPTESTVSDFWRMVTEQGASVIVMLSELGDGKCPRYWPEEENTYDKVSVRYVQAESCPYYTRREMIVKNRDGDDARVTHLQYHGWPTVDGEVPEVTRGLIELVDHSRSALVHEGMPTCMVVHCGLGSDRSSMFVGLSILVQQLRVEKRVDVFTVTRKLRSQRQAMISSFSQYEFLHRAIVNYAELHGLCDS